MKNQNSRTVLAIFSHADDELGCAGTLANHSEAGDKVHLLFLTKGENSTTVQGDSKMTITKRAHQIQEVSKLLGVNFEFMDFPDSQIEYSMENAYKVAEKIKQIRPDIVISWNVFSRPGAGHPDHKNTAKLVEDAINYARYQHDESEYEPYRENIHYYRYHNPNRNNKVNLQFIDVTDQEDKIQKFIEIYKEAYGDWEVEDFKYGSLRYWGRFAGAKLAEVFEVVTPPSNSPKLLP